MVDPFPTDPKPGERLSDGWTVHRFTRSLTGWEIVAISPDGNQTVKWAGETEDPRKNVYWKLYGGK